MFTEQSLQLVSGRFATNAQLTIQIRQISERRGRAGMWRRHPVRYQSTHLAVQHAERVQVDVVDRAP
jgi:hypothetical protein